MARLYYHTSGALLRLNVTEADEAREGSPAGSAGFLEFDETTNAAALASLAGQSGGRWQDHTVTAGQLRRSGVLVPLQADSPERTERQDFDQAAAAYLADLQAYLAIADTATQAQVREQVKRLTQGQARIVRLLRQLRRLQGG